MYIKYRPTKIKSKSMKKKKTQYTNHSQRNFESLQQHHRKATTERTLARDKENNFMMTKLLICQEDQIILNHYGPNH